MGNAGPLALEDVDLGVDQDHARVAQLAGRQGGVISRTQLLDLGVGRGAIEHRLATGSLHRRHRGVYVVGHLAKPPLQEEFAAVLACPTGSVVSHHAAAAQVRFRPAAVPPIDVTVVRGDRRRHPAIRIRPVAEPLDPADVRIRDGLPMTAPARTLLDLATVLTERDLRWALEEARVLRLVSGTELRAVTARYPRHRGTARLRALLGHDERAGLLTRSEAERRLVDLIEAARLPAPVTNTRIAGHEVDALWPTQRLVVEVDGYAFHAGRAAFERDRRRDADLQSAGLRVTRLSWRQITQEPLAVAALLARLLAAAP